MQCPSCKQAELQPAFIDGLFRSHQCENCEGHWLLIEDYVVWLERNKGATTKQEATYTLEESQNALICPMTGTIMRKFRINNDTAHKLDYSPPVGGVWLDRGEWEYLKDQGIAGCLNQIFTDQWQKQLRDSNTKATFEKLYLSKFGAEDYARIQELRTWLNSKNNKADLRNYLLCDDPYSV